MQSPQPDLLPLPSKTRRYLIFSDAKRPHHLCVCAARNKRHALEIARSMFRLHRTAHAIPESRAE